MPQVRRLSSHVIDRIAAGEVIDRPASVVKELLENALDAGATAIQVDILEGGLDLIRVADDGCGMNAEDLQLSVERHATSKLREAEDLFGIETLGFRGEALSSIASVSELRLTSRQEQNAQGWHLVMRGGKRVALEPMGAAPGTIVAVHDLFYNTPARRKFMRSPATEQAHVVESCLRVVLGQPLISCVVRSKNRELLRVPASGARVERACRALGRRVKNLFELDRIVGEISVRVLAAPPSLSRRDAKGMWFFVNGRFVKDRMLQRAAVDAYRSVMNPGRYPVLVVDIELEPQGVDVNVHPQKLEVRFAEQQFVYRAVSATLADLLIDAPWQVRGSMDARNETMAVETNTKAIASGQDYWTSIREEHRHASSLEEEKSLLSTTPFGGRASSGEHEVARISARVRLWRVGSRLVLVDRPAAWRIFIRDRLSCLWHSQEAVPRTAVMFPDTVQSEKIKELREEDLTCLKRLGFGVESIGPGSYLVRELPEILDTSWGAQLLVAIFDDKKLWQRVLRGEGSALEDLARCVAEVAREAESQKDSELLRALEALRDVHPPVLCFVDEKTALGMIEGARSG